jgi:transposase
MLSLSPATRIFLSLAPIDGRKGFNGLCTLVKETLEQEPTCGFLFVFINKARNRLKILTYDGSGLILYTKRLEAGTFARPAGEGKSLSLRPEDLVLLQPPGGCVSGVLHRPGSRRPGETAG